MLLDAKHPATRWAVPLVAAALAVGLPLAVTSQASAEPPLPARSASELLVDLQGLEPLPLQGEVRQVTDLGLPQLPGFATPTVKDASLGSLLTLASGTHTWRVWSDGAHASRLALVTGSAESDLIRNGRDVWIWSSADTSAVHMTLPDASAANPPSAANATKTPAEIADAVLASLDPTTAVSSARASYVAGRPVYELVLTPKQSGTKVGSVRLALDSQTKVPLRVQVFASDGTDAIDVAFTSVSFDAPDAGVFTFTPPPGTSVTEESADVCVDKECHPNGPIQRTGPSTVGTGWNSVIVAEAPSMTGTDRSVTALLDHLPTVSGDWGRGRLWDGSLLSVVLTDDGRVAAGAVPADALYAALHR